MEKFTEVIGFTDYLISDKGRVKTRARNIRYVHAVTKKEHYRRTIERLLKVYFNNNTGYKFIQLKLNKKNFNKAIHRLVAENFLPNPFQLKVVNHKDGNKHNNTVDNLEWCTDDYNHKHATETGLKAKGCKVSSSKLNDSSVHAIKWFLSKGVSHSELAKAFIISRPTISLIASNKTWKHVALTGKELEYVQ